MFSRRKFVQSALASVSMTSISAFLPKSAFALTEGSTQASGTWAIATDPALFGKVWAARFTNVLPWALDRSNTVLAKARNPEQTNMSDVMTRNPICVEPEMLVSDAVLIMIERGFRHLPIVEAGSKILGVFSVRDALPREIGNAVSLAEFNEQVNDAVG